MQPVLALYAGYSKNPKVIQPGADLHPYVQDALDEIEYVTGDASTKWGAQRIQDGHPTPFTLNYVEIGNEDFFDKSGSYDGRFAQFYDAIKAKYPHLQIISTVGNDHPESLRVHSRTPDLVDEHFYKTEEQMEAQSHLYDNRPRTGPKVFVGEWATRVGSPTPNMAGALGDAAWMCCMERNSDLVLLSSYAPLFVNVSDLAKGGSMQWRSDLLGYDALTSYGSPSYYAQAMFSSNHGDHVLVTDSLNVPTYTTRSGRQVPSLFFDATRDSRSGTIFLKIVNRLASPQSVHVKITGANNVDSSAEALVMSASSPDDTNSIQDPTKIVPVTSNVDGLGADFTRSFPPYSISVLQLKTN
jgi:alpha-N-arabinofuranosidase